MNNVGRILGSLGELYVVVLIVRALLSWFPYSPDSPFNGVRRVTFSLTEPVLAPFRKIIPPVGGLDLSFLVVVILCEVIVKEVLYRL